MLFHTSHSLPVAVAGCVRVCVYVGLRLQKYCKKIAVQRKRLNCENTIDEWNEQKWPLRFVSILYHLLDAKIVYFVVPYQRFNVSDGLTAMNECVVDGGSFGQFYRHIVISLMVRVGHLY